MPLETYVLAQESQLGVLRSAAAGLPAVRLVDLPLRDAVPDAVVSAARVLVLEIDPSVPESLERITRLRQQRPDLPLVAAMEHSDLALVRTMLRQGVNDVVSLPFRVEELSSAVLEAGAVEAVQVARLAPMVGVAGATGGVGATTVLTHLAASMGEQLGGPKGVCLIDLDIQFGTVTHYLGKQARTSVLDLVETGARLDEDMVRNAAIDTGRGFSVLAAPDAISPIEAIDVDNLLRMVALARKSFGFVLLDLPKDWTNWSLSAACACNEVVLLVDQSLNGLRQAKRCLTLFDTADIPTRRQTVAVNRVEKKLFQPIRAGEVAETLRRELVATIVADKADLATAQDQGVLVHEVNRRSAFVKDINTLASHLASQHSGDSA